MTAKKCKICKKEKSFSAFSKKKGGKYGLFTMCKKCRNVLEVAYRSDNKEKIALSSKKYRDKNKEKIAKSSKEYCKRNPEKIAAGKKKYYNENKEKMDEYRVKWEQENPEKRALIVRKCCEKNKENRSIRRSHRNKNDPQYKSSTLLRSRLSSALKNAKAKKHSNTMDLLGCNIEFFIEHIASQFTAGMSWDKFGYKGIHLDHIKPCASFDLTDQEQQRECFHWSNLQPLWAEDNMKKGSRYVPNHSKI